LQPLAAPLRAAPAEPDKAADDDGPEATPAAPAAATAPPVPEPAAVAPVEAAPTVHAGAPAASATAKPAADAIVANATNPRAACGSRVNFALLYCMQAQCAKPQFAKHAQCDELRRAGEVQ